MNHLVPWVIGRRWYIAHCVAGKEWKASENARRYGWEVFQPWYVRPRKTATGRVIGETRLPMLPGYFFAAGDRFLPRYELTNPMYVNKLLGPRDDPFMIDDADPVMRALRKKADVDDFVAEAKAPLFTYGPGDTVIVDAGVFGDNLQGNIEHMSKEQLKIWLPLMGKGAPVLTTVKHDQVKRKVAG